MSRSHYFVEPVYAYQRATKRARDVAGRNLCVGQACRDAQTVWREERGVDQSNDQCRNAVESSRIRERLNDSSIGAAERRNISRKPQPKLVVENTEVTADDGLGVHRPGGSNARREVFLGDEF